MATVRTPEIKAVVSVDGETMPFVSLKISQEMGEHHDFELLLDHKTQGENIVITANKDITISAGETLTLNAKNMIVNVEESQQNFIGENMATSVGKNQQTAVTETIEITSKNMEETYIEDVNTTIGENQTTTSGESELFTTKGNIVMKSASKALLQGAKDARISKG